MNNESTRHHAVLLLVLLAHVVVSVWGSSIASVASAAAVIAFTRAWAGHQPPSP